MIPFGLKNARATYQRAMVALFHDMIHHEIKVYVDDMIARSQTEEEHLNHFQKLFVRLKEYKLKLNPNKCTFGVRSGKPLGFIVSNKGIEVDPAKVKAIQEIPAPRNEKECCTPKFSLSYFSKHCKKNLQVAQGCSRVGQTSYLLRKSTPN